MHARRRNDIGRRNLRCTHRVVLGRLQLLALTAGLMCMLAAACTSSSSGGESAGQAQPATASPVATPATATPRPTQGPEPTSVPRPPPTAVPTATAVPTVTPVATVTPVPDPTPAVSPTPTWVLTEGGPRVSPFTYIIDATVPHPNFLPAADGWSIAIARNPDELAEPADLTRPVLSGQPGDDVALVPMPRYGQLANADTEDFVWRESNRLLEIDVTLNRLRIFEGNNLLFEQPVSTGIRDAPILPAEAYFESYELYEDRPGGTMRIGVIPSQRGSSSIEGVEAVTLASVEDAVLGRWNTEGFVMVDDATWDQIIELLPKGSKVDIFGAQPADS